MPNRRKSKKARASKRTAKPQEKLHAITMHVRVTRKQARQLAAKFKAHAVSALGVRPSAVVQRQAAATTEG